MQTLKHLVLNNLGIAVFYGLLTLGNLGVFSAAFFFRFEHGEWLAAVTAGFGKCLLWDSALLPITVCRRIIAWVRETPLHIFVPSKHHRRIHRTLSLTVCIIAMCHALTAILDDYTQSLKPGSKPLLSLLFDPSDLSDWTTITGAACLGVMAVIIITSLLRHYMSFLAFFLTHQLYLLLYALMILHAGHFWIYLVLPVLLFSAELLLRIVYKSRESTIVEVTLLPSNVVILVLSRPPKMIFKPGDYLFIHIPKICRFEWVKATITSAPEQQDTLTVHVLVKNNWSYRLRNHFLRDVSFHYIPHRLHVLESITVIQRLRKAWRNMFGGFQNIQVPMGKPRETRKERMQRNKVDAMRTEEKHLTLDVVFSHHLEATASEPAQQATPELAAAGGAPAAALLPSVGTPRPVPSRLYDAVHGHLEAEASHFVGFGAGYSTYSQNFGKTLQFGGARPRPRNVSDERRKTAAGAEADIERARRYKRHSVITSLDELGYRVPVTETPPPPAPAAPSSVPRLPPVGAGRPALPATDQDNSIASSMRRRRREEELIDDDDDLEDDVCLLDETIKVYMDGPYSHAGSECTGIFTVKHAIIVLVGSDVYPIAAVLQSILIRYRSEIVPCPKCACEFKMQLPSSFMNIRKVDFVWVNSDMEGFEWFLELLSDMDSYQKKRNLLENFLEFRLFKTGLKPLPSFTPLRDQLRQGRPRWDEVLGQVLHSSPGDMEVFFAGPRTVRNVVRRVCADMDLVFNTLHF